MFLAKCWLLEYPALYRLVLFPVNPFAPVVLAPKAIRRGDTRPYQAVRGNNPFEFVAYPAFHESACVVRVTADLLNFVLVQADNPTFRVGIAATLLANTPDEKFAELQGVAASVRTPLAIDQHGPLGHARTARLRYEFFVWGDAELSETVCANLSHDVVTSLAVYRQGALKNRIIGVTRHQDEMHHARRARESPPLATGKRHDTGKGFIER